MNQAIRPRRSMLYVSSAVDKHLQKARALPADSLIFDLHETVYPARKDEVRQHLVDYLTAGGFEGQELIVRVNALGTHWLDDDLKAMTTLPIDAILFPEINGPQDVVEARRLLDEAGGKHLPLMAMIETPMAVLNAEEIAAVEPRLNCLVLNTNRLTAEMGVQPTSDRLGLVYLLSRVILAARAYNKVVIDGAHLNLREAQSCEFSCRQGRDLGFDGKTVVHPVQLAYTNDAFTPRPKDVAKARTIIEAMEAVRAKGEAVTMIDGHVITEDVEEAARYTIELAATIEAYNKRRDNAA